MKNNESLFISDIENAIIHLINDEKYQPMRQHEIAHALKLESESRHTFRGVLRDLEARGLIRKLRKNRWAPVKNANLHEGVFSQNRKGFGMVKLSNETEEMIFIPPRQVKGAMHGDHVLVYITTDSRDAKDQTRRREGRIERILSRGTKCICGVLKHETSYSYVIPDNPQMQQDIRVKLDDALSTMPEEGNIVVVYLDTENISGSGWITGRITEDLGKADDSGVDVLSIIREHEFRTSFSEQVVKAAHKHQTVIDPETIEPERRNIMERECFTIDPFDAKDLDDAVSIEKLDNGNFRLGVHIADVAHYVQQGSTLDREACERATSVYLVDRVIPMLPGHLTTDVCSLNPGVPKRTHTADMEITSEGEVISVVTYRSLIKSSAQLNYEQVQMLFDGKDNHHIPPALCKSILVLDQLTQVLRKKRMAEGSLSFTLPEAKCLLNENGTIRKIVKRSAKRSYQLVEDCMLAANVAVAEQLHKAGVPMIYRIHAEPTEEQWAQMYEDLQLLGLRDAMVGDQHDLNRLTDRTEKLGLAHAIRLAILRNLQRARYTTEQDVHFGLGFDLYTHFTSPIRRYPDLLIHRILRTVEDRKSPPYNGKELEELAVHCSQKNMEADLAERESVEVKRVRYLEQCMQDGFSGPYECVITNLTPRGLVVEMTENLQQGLIKYASISHDYYEYDAEKNLARSRHGKHVFRVGMEIKADIIKVDTARRLVDLVLHEKEKKKRPVKKKAVARKTVPANRTVRKNSGKKRRRR